MSQETTSFHKAADQFLKAHYENNDAENIFFSYGFLARSAKEAKQVAKSLALKDMDYQNAIVATWFRFAGILDIAFEREDKSIALLEVFFNKINYPVEERSIVKSAIEIELGNRYPETKVQKTVCDGVNSRLATPNFLENIVLLKDELSRLNKSDKGEPYFINYFLDIFTKKRYYTDYANENYAAQQEKNFQMLEKRAHKFEILDGAVTKGQEKDQASTVLSNKETEDLFKLAFRNYNHLISVADSKASLLIRVNSIILSVVIGLVLGKVERNIYLLLPTILLLIVCLSTIFLSILASRPQKNSFSEDKNSHSYQKFFFGSFDLIDPSFRKATWDGYYLQLQQLFTGAKEIVYLEVFKESYNVRKVLSKKFSYLSIAYWVFMIGLSASIIAFILSLRSQTLL